MPIEGLMKKKTMHQPKSVIPLKLASSIFLYHYHNQFCPQNKLLHCSASLNHLQLVDIPSIVQRQDHSTVVQLGPYQCTVLCS